MLVISYLISLGLFLISIFIESNFSIDVQHTSKPEALVFVGFEAVVALFSVLNSLHLSELIKKSSNQRLLFSVSLFATLWLVATAFGGIWNLPSSIENIELVQSYSDAKFEKVGDNCYRLNGHIGLQASTSLKTLPLNENTVIQLNSGGGLLEPAIEIANLISLNHVTVYVDSECLSACVLIAIKAEKLIASEDALFGFHRASSVSKKVNSLSKYASEKATETLRFELEMSGADESILTLVTTTDNEAMAYLTGEDLFKKGLVDSLYLN